MPDRVRVEAPAKLNLHLAVGPLREDGYHDIVSLIHAVRFGDTLWIQRRAGGPSVTVRGNRQVPQHRDLAARAAEGFMCEAGVSARIEIAVEKRIPIGGGLGGGSSDAASTLLGMDTLFPAAVSSPRIARLAAELGSDVPFFLHTPAAVVSGRGEQVRPCAARADLSVVIVDGGVSVSTAEAFRLLDEYREHHGGESEDRFDPFLVECLARAPGIWSFRNDFTPVLVRHYPVLQAGIEELRRSGAEFAAVTGSGGCLFGVFASEYEARRALDALTGARAWKTVLLESRNRPALE